MRTRVSFISVFIFASLGMFGWGCNAPSTQETTLIGTSSSSSTGSFAGGTKAVKVLLSRGTGGSFSVPGAVPTPTVIPVTYPGYDGSSAYTPGISAATYYDVDGTTVIAKPNWLLDVQVGVTTVGAGAGCAKFGDSGGSKDVNDYYRVDESSCAATAVGSGITSGVSADPVFVRVILNRDASAIGLAENLLMQVEYQASALRFNSDGVDPDPENNLDHLWKVFWNSTLGTGVIPKTFSVFIPPNYSACTPSGTGNGIPATSACDDASYRGSPIKVKQILLPLSSSTDMKVVQLSRVKGRVNSDAPYVASFCAANEPLCLGVVIRSITLMRI